MAIKDLIGPGFIGGNTVEFIVTRGMGTAASTIHYFVQHNQIIGDIASEELFRQGVALTGYTFLLINKTTGAAITSGTVTSKITKDGGTQGSTTNSATHEGNGQWSINLTSDEMDAEIIGLTFTHTNAIAEHRTIKTHG